MWAMSANWAMLAKASNGRVEFRLLAILSRLATFRGTLIAPVHSVAKFIFGDISRK
jgi:hypothetical protein